MPAELTGYVDDFRRPLVRITVDGLFDSTLSLVDTGFNDSILIPIDLAFAAGLDPGSSNLGLFGCWTEVESIHL